VSRWTCPACDREFGRAHQSHVCVPGCTVDRSFQGRPAVQRAIYDAIITHLRTLGPVHEDAVTVGVFLLNERKFAEVRPMARKLKLYLFLPRRIEHPRIQRQERISADRTWLTIGLGSVDEVDDELREWLAEAYDAADDTA
jgi:Domain of unknown function (DUF5655)